VLSLAERFMREHLLDGYVVECDPTNSDYKIIQDNPASLLRPDVVIFNYHNKKISMSS
jgi:hypothetical protein